MVVIKMATAELAPCTGSLSLRCVSQLPWAPELFSSGFCHHGVRQQVLQCSPMHSLSLNPGISFRLCHLRPRRNHAGSSHMSGGGEHRCIPSTSAKHRIDLAGRSCVQVWARVSSSGTKRDSKHPHPSYFHIPSQSLTTDL